MISIITSFTDIKKWKVITLSNYKTVIVKDNEAKMNALIDKTSIRSNQIEASENIDSTEVIYWICATSEQINELKKQGYSVENILNESDLVVGNVYRGYDDVALYEFEYIGNGNIKLLGAMSNVIDVHYGLEMKDKQQIVPLKEMDFNEIRDFNY